MLFLNNSALALLDIHVLCDMTKSNKISTFSEKPTLSVVFPNPQHITMAFINISVINEAQLSLDNKKSINCADYTIFTPII
jgi:hypothetical protein